MDKYGAYSNKYLYFITQVRFSSIFMAITTIWWFEVKTHVATYMPNCSGYM